MTTDDDKLVKRYRRNTICLVIVCLAATAASITKLRWSSANDPSLVMSLVAVAGVFGVRRRLAHELDKSQKTQNTGS